MSYWTVAVNADQPRAGLMPRDTGGSASDTAARLRPLGDVGPVPSRPAADCPLRIGQQSTVAPDVSGGSLDAESFGYLGQSNRITGHRETVAKLLTPSNRCGDNHYMTSTHTSTAPTTFSATEAGALNGFQSHCTCGLTMKSSLLSALELDRKQHAAWHAKAAK